jgi:RNA polymerase sigma-70 factor (ECF subfamily)
VDDAESRTEISRAYAEHRPYLTDLAFRILGDIGAAQDAVQDAFWRLLRADLSEIGDERGWLIVVTSRLCLDRIRSAPARRERAHDASEIEYTRAAAAVQPPLADPADRVTLDDGVRLALLAMLQRLSPAERVVFVLHDVFRLPFAEVASSVGRPEPSCRQLARRARQKISAAGEARFGVAPAEHRLVTEKFIAACATGDLRGLTAVLAPDAWGEADLGPAFPAPGLVTGAEAVAANLLQFWGQGATLVSHPVAGQPAILAYLGRDLAGLITFTLRGGLIQSVHVVADPVTFRGPFPSLPGRPPARGQEGAGDD